MWRPDRSLRGPDRPTLAGHRAAQPRLRRCVHRPLQPRRPGRRPRAAPQHAGLALRDRGRRRRRHGLARRRRAARGVQHGRTSRASKAGWGRSRCGPTARARAWAPPWSGSGSTGSRRRARATIGLETMPRTVENIGFYSRIGLVPGTAHRHPGARRAAPRRPRRPSCSRRRAARRAERLEECRQLTDELAPGVDFSREITLTRDLGIGDTTLVREDGELLGLRALALDAARRRPGRRTRFGCSSWWRGIWRRSIA